MTFAEKIIARAAGGDSVTAGQVVACKIDPAMIHDSGEPRRVAPMQEWLGVRPAGPSRIVVIPDHDAPAVDMESATILDLTRRWVKRECVPPSTTCRASAVSYRRSAGAFGCSMSGVGAAEMAGVYHLGNLNLMWKS